MYLYFGDDSGDGPETLLRTTRCTVAAIGYAEIAEELREEIASGVYKPDETLPKQKELAAHYHVNVGTIRRAINSLAAEGLVDPTRRKGTVVRRQPRMKRLGVERYAKERWAPDAGGSPAATVGAAADREASGTEWDPTHQTQSVTLVQADRTVADAFDIDPGAPVYERARLVRNDERPTHTLTSYYLPSDVEGSLLVADTAGPAGERGGFGVLADRGLIPDHIAETIKARMPTPTEKKTLKLREGEPVMLLERRTYTSNDKLIEFARGVHAASLFAWTYQFKIPDKIERSG